MTERKLFVMGFFFFKSTKFVFNQCSQCLLCWILKNLTVPVNQPVYLTCRPECVWTERARREMCTLHEPQYVTPFIQTWHITHNNCAVIRGRAEHQQLRGRWVNISSVNRLNYSLTYPTWVVLGSHAHAGHHSLLLPTRWMAAPPDAQDNLETVLIGLSDNLAMQLSEGIW